MDALRLAENHRTSQARLAEAFLRRLAALYDAQIPSGFRDDRVVDRWLATMLPLIRAARLQSAARAGAYLTQAAALAGAPAPDIAPPDDVEDEALRTSLRVTGVIGLVEALERGNAFADAVKTARTAAEGAADRHVLNGGRTSILNTVQRDAGIIGYYRQTRDGCCSFCAMLASRGVIGPDGKPLGGRFQADSFAASDPRFEGDGTVKVHDHCHCQPVPIYIASQQLPDANQQYAELWRDSTKGYSGNDALNAFRRAYEAKFLRGAQ